MSEWIVAYDINTNYPSPSPGTDIYGKKKRRKHGTSYTNLGHQQVYYRVRRALSPYRGFSSAQDSMYKVAAEGVDGLREALGQLQYLKKYFRNLALHFPDGTSVDVLAWEGEWRDIPDLRVGPVLKLNEDETISMGHQLMNNPSDRGVTCLGG